MNILLLIPGNFYNLLMRDAKPIQQSYLTLTSSPAQAGWTTGVLIGNLNFNSIRPDWRMVPFPIKYFIIYDLFIYGPYELMKALIRSSYNCHHCDSGARNSVFLFQTQASQCIFLDEQYWFNFRDSEPVTGWTQLSSVNF